MLLTLATLFGGLRVIFIFNRLAPGNLVFQIVILHFQSFNFGLQLFYIVRSFAAIDLSWLAMLSEVFVKRNASHQLYLNFELYLLNNSLVIIVIFF